VRAGRTRFEHIVGGHNNAHGDNSNTKFEHIVGSHNDTHVDNGATIPIDDGIGGSLRPQ
jgi:hypothetical protein